MLGHVAKVQSGELRARRIRRDDAARERKLDRSLRAFSHQRRSSEIERQRTWARIVGYPDPWRPREEHGAPMSGPVAPEPQRPQPWEPSEELPPVEALGRAERYRLLDGLRSISLKRTAICRRTRVSADVQLLRRSGKLVTSGVCTCGSIHGCPVCAAPLYQKRAAEIDSCIRQWLGSDEDGTDRIGPQSACAYMWTATIAHGAGDSLRFINEGLANAWRFFFAGRHGQRLRQELGIAHCCRNSERTHGRNGWHPHLHTIALTTRELTYEQIERLQKRWADCVERALGTNYKPSVRCGFDSTRVRFASDGRYVAKAGLEVAGGIDTKSASCGNRTYWQVAKDAAAGDDASRILWRNAQRDLFRSRQITWSRGMRRTFGLDDLTDEEVVKNETEQQTDDAVFIVIPGATWDGHCRRDRFFLSRVVAHSLRAAESGDWGALARLVRPPPDSG